MTSIKISFVKNSTGNYDYMVVQNGKMLFKKEYTASVTDETGLSQAQVFSGFANFLQDVVNKELEKNPDFHWNSFSDFKRFEGAKLQHRFWECEADYIDLPDAKMS